MAQIFSPLLAAFSRVVPAAPTTYANPVQGGDFPDPSIVRVGERDFYATTTSTDWAPQFPIFHSRDLVSWTLVGAVFTHRPSWSVGSFWAPEISVHAGRYYVYYVARRSAGPLCVAVASADHPAGPYVDHGPLVGQASGSIDPMATTDECGRRWLVWKEDGNSVGRPTPIWAQRLTDDGLSLSGDKHELIRNDAPWEDHVVEAPVIFARDGWLYMIYSGNACCGEDCAYAVGAARARTMAGPWEKCPANPILRGNAAFKCPGHGSVTTDASGRTYYLYHAYTATRGAFAVGRQLMLDRIDWGSDGWPTINGGSGPSSTAATPMNVAAVRSVRTFYDDFTAPSLEHGWQWPQGSIPDMQIDPRRGGHVVVRARSGGGTCDILDAVLARPIADSDYVATTALDVRATSTDGLASLTAFGSRRDALGIGVRNASIVVWRRRAGKITVVARAPVEASAVIHLRLTVSVGSRIRPAFSRDGKTWTDLGATLDGAYLPPWDRGVRIALTAGGVAGAQGRFDFLRIRSLARREQAVRGARPGLRARRAARVNASSR